LLEAEGFEVIGTEDGLKGVEFAKQQQPDLIICDIMMPEMNGYEVLEVLQQNKLTAVIPFIFLSAFAEKGAVRRGMELGADDYLTKPFTFTELLKAISTRLAKQQIIKGSYSAQLKQKEAELNLLTHYNPLTGLPNQLLLKELFEQRLISQISPDCYLPVLSLSLDRFDWISQSLGLPWAELLIKAVAQRLRSNLDSSAIVAHCQLDQFVIIPGIFKEREAVVEVVEQLQQVLAEQFILGNHELSVTASIGIALYPDDNCTIEALMRNALAVVYQVRKAGGNNYQFYKSIIYSEALEQLSLETALRHGLQRDEFEVYYQPQVRLETNQIVGVEALVRWRHPQMGLISPARFIPLAEQTGLIIPLGEWVLRKACEQTRAWQLTVAPHLRVAVNLSARQFSQPG
jgi:diguanylate cyclase (GGDEF)-like protein